MISNFSVRSSVTRYNMPPSAFVMLLAATRMVSSSRAMSVSCDSATPMALSCSAPEGPWPGSAVRSAALMARLYLMQTERDVGDAREHLFDPHAHSPARWRTWKHDPGILLDAPLDRIGAHQQLMCSRPGPGSRYHCISSRPVHKAWCLVAECLDPLPQLGCARGVRALLPRVDGHRFDVLRRAARRARRWSRCALSCSSRTGAGQALRRRCRRRVSEIERIHAHVEQPHDGLRRAVRMQCRQHEVAGQGRLDGRRRSSSPASSPP